MLLRFWLSGYNIFLFGILGTLIGLFIGEYSSMFKPLGDFFIQLIRMLIIPIIVFSVLNSTARLSETNKAGKVGVYSISYFFITTVTSVVIGLFIAFYFEVGIGLKTIPESLMNGEALYAGTESIKIVGFWDFVIGIVPINPVEAMTNGNIIQILVFTIFLGISISYLNNYYKDTFIKQISLLNDAFLFMMGKIMYMAPIGVFGLTSYAVGTLGIEVVALVLKLFLYYVLGSLFLVYVILGLLVHFFSNISYFGFFKALIPLKIVSFTTASSLVSLPTTLKNCEDMGLNKNICNFVIPIGATINMNGNAMFNVMVAVFFAQVFNVELTLSLLIIISFTSIVGAIGSAGVPGPTVIIIAVLVSAGIPIEGVPLLFAVDRIFDMLRTSVNVIGDASCAAILDKMIPEEDKAV